MEAFTQRVEEEAGSSVSDNGFLSTDDLRLESSEAACTSRDRQDETAPASLSESVISTQKLPLYEGPEIIQRLNVFEEVELGAVIVFECQCKGNPLPTSKWYKDDVELVSADRVTIEDTVETDGKIRLTIQNARKLDEGAYRCKLENQEGVAATTGYLSVTGSSSSSPKSEHYSVGSTPLLRAITEESNASQDLDETLSTPLDKILTGEYDLTTLPYSQYLELLKENKANSAHQTVGGLSIEGDERQRTSQQKSAENGDVTTEEADSRAAAAVVLDTSETPPTARFAENDYFEMSLSSNDSTNSFDASESPSVARVSTYGLGGFHPIQVVRENFGGDGSSSFETEENRAEKTKKIAGSDSPILREFNGIVTAAAADDGGNGDFVGTVNAADDGKLSLAETVIAGRIGLPSDWEFAHYTQESEDNEAVFSEHGLPYEAGYQVATAEAGSENVETPPSQIDVLPDRIRTPSQERIQEGPEGVPESSVSNEASPGSGVVPVDRDSSGGAGLSERAVEKMAELSESDFPRNPSNAIREPEPVSPDEERSTRIGNKSDSSSQTPGKVGLDLKAVLLEPPKVETVFADVTSETASVVGREDEKITADEPEHATNKLSTQLPGGEEAVKRPPEVAPKTEAGLAVAFPANEVSVSDVRSFPADEWTLSDLEKSGETLPTTEDATPTENFDKFNIGSLPEIPSAFTPLPDLTPQILHWEEEEEGPVARSPVRVEDIEVSVTSDQSLVEWCVEWFQFPWFFYVLLVLMATVVASAMQLNPALLILVVSTVSVAGFFLFPLQGVKSNKKQQ